MKDERLVVGTGGCRIGFCLKQPESASRIMVAYHRLNHRDRKRPGGIAHWILASRLDNHQLRREVLQIEGVFTLLIGRVQWGGRHVCCHSHECRSHFRSVRQHDGHAVGRAEPISGKLAPNRIDMLAKGCICHGRAIGCGKGDGIIGAGIKQSADGHGRARLS